MKIRDNIKTGANACRSIRHEPGATPSEQGEIKSPFGMATLVSGKNPQKKRQPRKKRVKKKKERKRKKRQKKAMEISGSAQVENQRLAYYAAHPTSSIYQD